MTTMGSPRSQPERETARRRARIRILAMHKALRDGQKCRPARPQRVKARGVPLRYVEGLNDARTKLAEFLSSLLLISHRLIELRQTRTRQRELGLYLDARRYQDRRMEHNIADRDLELRLL